MRSNKLKLLIGVSFATLAFAVVVNGQANWLERERKLIRPTSTSPFSLARLLRHQSSQTFPVDMSGVWQSLGITPGDFETCQGECEAKIFRTELDNSSGREVILELTRLWNVRRFLVYKKGNAGSPRWKFLGYVDHDFNRYWMAEHRVVRAFGKNWLVIRGQEGSGSGYYLNGDTWFEVNKKGVRPVLHYSVDGLTDAGIGGLNWKLKSRPVAVGGARAPTIRLRFVVYYTAQAFEDFSFTRRFVNRRDAYYGWNKRSRQFVFSGRPSTISEYEMNLVANVETEPSSENGGVKIGGSTFFSSLKGFVGSGYEMFLRLNAPKLVKIARSRDGQSKVWLGKFLTQCEDIPEKLAIEKALQEKL